MANIDPSRSQIWNYGSSFIYQTSGWDDMSKLDKVSLISSAGGALAFSVVAIIFTALVESTPIILAALIGLGPVGPALLGIVILIAITLAIAYFASKSVSGASRRYKVEELVKQDLSQENVRDKLAGHLCSWAGEGEIKKLKTLLEYESIAPQKKQQIVDIFLNGQGDDGNSPMSLLIQQQIPDFFILACRRSI